MVIERALEKMRQNAGLKPEAPSPPHLAAGQVERRKSATPRPPEARVAVKPAFPTLSVDPSAAEVHHILLPHVNLSEPSRGSAAYRMLRTRLLHRLRTNHWRTLAITSPGAAEGK